MINVAFFYLFVTKIIGLTIKDFTHNTNMNNKQFYSNLIEMYLKAPVNKAFDPSLTIEDKKSYLEIEVNKNYFHAAHYVHGAILFKLLDDSAYFAAQSIEHTNFIVTATFNSHFIRPVNKGTLRAEGNVITQTKSRIISKSAVFNQQSKLIAYATGVFMPSSSRLDEIF